ncbi:hypothetical protein [Streptacidiphilus jiangxiensis]|uniref:hypothetical protein n=1 Tax=Streptacidiphilus jiangxiensis TaxID=235985 RepID=UPI0005A6A162|nr:hypothetical protein [Streptacidiphilus jiangxiensis]
MSLPGADELFRTTGGTTLTPVPRAPDQAPPAAAEEPSPATQLPGASEEGRPADPAGEHGAAAAPFATPQVPPARGDAQRGAEAPARPVSAATRAAQAASEAVSQPAAARRKARAPRSRPTGRERHEEKITVYVSAEELFDLEHARLLLRGEYGLAVDRGRIVREAVAVVLADLEQRGEASILVRRLRGR